MKYAFAPYEMFECMFNSSRIYKMRILYKCTYDLIQAGAEYADEIFLYIPYIRSAGIDALQTIYN